MENKKKKSIIYPTIFMIILAAILTFILALFNQETKPLVARNAELELKQKILYVLSVENDGSLEDIENKFEEYIIYTGEDYNEEPIYALQRDGNIESYAFSLKGAGLWGPITGYLGLNDDYSQVVGIDFITQSETPGLGGRIEEDFYKEQYRNVPVDQVSESVDTISGATSTSRAVETIVKDDLGDFLESVGGAN